MAKETFDQNLMRAIAAELHVLTGLIVAREMFGKSYFSLGVSEKATVDQTLLGMVANNYQSLTAEQLATREAPRAPGFLDRTEDKS